MADLGELLGTLMASLARAREIADIETSAIAQRYKDNPLLEGISLPRVRVPEITLDLPLLIEAEVAGESAQPENPDVIHREISNALEESAARNNVILPPEVTANLSSSLANKLRNSTAAANTGTTFAAHRETIVRTVENAVSEALHLPEIKNAISGDKLRAILSDVRQRADRVAVKTPGKAPIINATFITSIVKEKADANNVTRIRMTLKEEGLEWSVVQNEDGTTSRRLQPE